MEDTLSNQTNLIVNYLPQCMSDEDFQALFREVGPFKSAKICRDKHTNYSYGFGFVDYVHPEDAQKAIQALNRKQVNHKTIKVALARPPDAERKGANLYVWKLPKHYTDADLMDLFRPYGNVVSGNILKDQATGESKTVGFVLFDKKPEADMAIERVNGTVPPGGSQAMGVKFADDGNKKGRQLLHRQQQLLGGPMRNQMGGRYGNRYNPMAMGDSYSANFYQDVFDPTGFTTAGVTQQPRDGGFTLFVYGVGNDCQETDLQQMFSRFGAVKKVDVVWDHAKQQCKGYAFVSMYNGMEAANAVNLLNGSMYKGKKIEVSFKK